MRDSVFVEGEFFALILCSLVAPVAIYYYLMRLRSISRAAVLAFGLTLITLSGTDVFLLRRLREMSRATPSVIDDKVFASELSVALYLLPVLFAGIGVNMVSHILIRHLTDAENRFDHEG